MRSHPVLMRSVEVRDGCLHLCPSRMAGRDVTAAAVGWLMHVCWAVAALLGRSRPGCKSEW